MEADMQTCLRQATLLIVLGLVLGLGLGLGAGCGDDDSGTDNNNNNVNSNQNTASCGDGNLDDGEQCDDGAANSDSTPDACRTDCRNFFCQDGVTDTGEDCDDGNNSDTDGCLANCVVNVCGDGHVNETLDATGDQVEACDDPDPALCRPDCGQDLRDCGNGDPTDQGEACDDGTGFNGDNPNSCRANCQLPSCGDDIRDDLFAEECDDGTQNEVSPSGCRADCTLSICGDGYVGGTNEAGDPEECDETNLAGQTCEFLGYTGGTLACTPFGAGDGCMFDVAGCFSTCGNGIVESGESCDGTELNGETCATIEGYTGGELACQPGLCQWEYAGCFSCGNNECELDQGETSSNCPGDCECGDMVCDHSTEDTISCANDCICGDGNCEDHPMFARENHTTCPTDCPCGDGFCAWGDTNALCPTDCNCGNGRCDIDETPAGCPTDCSRDFGEACWNDAHCGGITSLPARCIDRSGSDSSYDMPFGFCTGRCLEQSHCASLGGWCHVDGQVCLKPCTGDGDCRQTDNYTCTAAYGGNYCLGPYI